MSDDALVTLALGAIAIACVVVFAIMATKD